MCGSGGNEINNHQNSSRSPSWDTVFYVGQHQYLLKHLNRDTSFVDTIFVVNPGNDSIRFYYTDVLLDVVSNSFSLIRGGFVGFSPNDTSDSQYKIDLSDSKGQFIISFRLNNKFTGKKHRFDSLYYNKFETYKNVNGTLTTQHINEFFGRIISR